MNNFINEYMKIILEHVQHVQYDKLISYFSNIKNFKKLIKGKKENNDIALEHLNLFETDKKSAIKSALEWKKLVKDNQAKILFYAEQRKYNRNLQHFNKYKSTHGLRNGHGKAIGQPLHNRPFRFNADAHHKVGQKRNTEPNSQAEQLSCPIRQ